MMHQPILLIFFSIRVSNTVFHVYSIVARHLYNLQSVYITYEVFPLMYLVPAWCHT